MPKFLILFLAIVVLAIDSPAQAQMLWGKTSVGMNPSQVMRTVQGSRKIEDGRSLESGAKELVRLDSLPLVGKTFTVKCYFEKEELIQVTLTLNGQYTFVDALEVYNPLKDGLVAKYGPPIDEESLLRPGIGLLGAEWLRDSVSIKAQALAMDADNALLVVTYIARPKDESEKL